MAHILIIDDSPTDLRILTTLLERAGFRVSTADNGEAGVARARALRPDLVIMDVIMPGMNGFQATRTLSRDPATAHLPVLVITTKSMETDRVWALRQGARDFITKPIQEKDLLGRIRKVLAEAA